MVERPEGFVAGLTDTYALEEMLGRAEALLGEALAGAPSAERRFDVLDEFLLVRLDGARSPVPAVTHAGDAWPPVEEAGWGASCADGR
ncbi:MAG: hypothetical protein WA862_01070 [Solirubrobacterales bacterium]